MKENTVKRRLARRKSIVIYMMVVIFILTSTGVISAFADTEIDNTAPVIKSISLSTGSSFDIDKDSLIVDLDIVEDGVGVIEVEVRAETTSGTKHTAYFA